MSNKPSIKVQSVLISQPKPVDENHPYFSLKDKYGLKMDFRKFIQIEGVSTEEFRKQGLNPLDFTAVILTSKVAIDNFFRILKDLKVEMPAETKYFCVSEGSAKYLQKYIQIRKRKLFVGERSSRDLLPLIKKHGKDNFLYPCSAIHTPTITDFLEAQGYEYAEAVMYNTVASDLSDLKSINYDMICFYSPSGIDSLFKNFPNFVKDNENTLIAVFGPTTSKAAVAAGLRVDIQAPMPNAPSMTAAIELYLKENGQ